MRAPSRRRALRAVVRGRVQGVGFRWFAAERAQSLGLAGAVFNRRDGTVETVAEGPPDALEAYLGHLKAGPPAASVLGVEEEWREATGGFKTFEVWPTAL